MEVAYEYDVDPERDAYFEANLSENQTTENEHASVTPQNLQVVRGRGRGRGRGRSRSSKDASQGRRAPVWKHFTLSERFDGKIPKPNEKATTTYATCNYCERLIKAESGMGTSTCGNHLKICRKAPKLEIDSACDQSISSFDQKIWLSKWAKAVICHAYPLRMVEHRYFREAISYLNKDVKHVSRNTLLKCCIAEHEKFKAMLFDSLGKISSKVSFTCDLWTACTNRGYLTLTAHYVNDDWVLKSQILNYRFCPPPHSGLEVGKFVFNLIKEWKLENKVFCMTVDNARSMDVMIGLLKKDVMNCSLLPCGGDFFHVRCCAHVLNLIVRKGLEYVDETVGKLREVVKYIDGSDSRLTQFEQAVSDIECAFQGKLSLDVVTRWNATYLMLQKALKAKEAIKTYVSRFLGIDYHLTDDEWDTIQDVCDFLLPFYKITTMFSGSDYPTANLYFEQVLFIEYHIKEAHKVPKLASMASMMMGKFENYWEDYSLILSIAAVLDPRYKIKRVKHLYGLLYVGDAVDEKVKKVMDALRDMYNFYSAQPAHPPPGSSSDAPMSEFNDGGQHFALSKAYQRCDAFDDDDSSTTADLDTYLAQPLIKPGEQFDVLQFWKGQVEVYPTLSRVARDVLAIPITSVASESSFSMGGRILTKYRSALLPKNVEMLVTTQNWCLGYDTDIDEDVLLIGEEVFNESVASNW